MDSCKLETEWMEQEAGALQMMSTIFSDARQVSAGGNDEILLQHIAPMLPFELYSKKTKC